MEPGRKDEVVRVAWCFPKIHKKIMPALQPNNFDVKLQFAVA